MAGLLWWPLAAALWWLSAALGCHALATGLAPGWLGILSGTRREWDVAILTLLGTGHRPTTCSGSPDGGGTGFPFWSTIGGVFVPRRGDLWPQVAADYCGFVSCLQMFSVYVVSAWHQNMVPLRNLSLFRASMSRLMLLEAIIVRRSVLLEAFTVQHCTGWHALCLYQLQVIALCLLHERCQVAIYGLSWLASAVGLFLCVRVRSYCFMLGTAIATSHLDHIAKLIALVFVYHQ